jgi:hypothetical protein
MVSIPRIIFIPCYHRFVIRYPIVRSGTDSLQQFIHRDDHLLSTWTIGARVYTVVEYEAAALKLREHPTLRASVNAKNVGGTYFL